MIGIKRLAEFGNATIDHCPTLKSVEVVATESELKDVINKVREWPLLVCVLPDATGDDRSYDNVAESNAALFYVVEPLKERMTRDQRIELWARTQQGMKELKEYIHANICGEFADMFRDTDFYKRTQEPEYNLLDCCGWSLLFSFTTDWF